MKKIILFLLIFSLFFISSVNLVSANWYGNHGVSYDSNSWTSGNHGHNTTECKEYTSINGSQLSIYVDSESNRDFVRYYFNGTLQWSRSGNMKGAFYGNNSVGTHKICYTKDGSVSHYNDNAGVAFACDSDGDTTGGSNRTYGEFAVANNNSSSSLTPQTDAEYPIAASGTMRCLYWDRSIPTNPTSLTLSNVKNDDSSNCNLYSGVYYCNTSNISFIYNWSGASDAGGSGIKDYQIVFQKSSDLTWIHSEWVTGTSKNISLTGLENSMTYYTWVRVRDNALNTPTSFFKGPDVYIDTTPPTLSDVTNSNQTNLLANSSYSYSISVGVNGGSSIVRVEGAKENKDNESLTTFTDISSPWNQTWDTSKVDNFRQTNGGRQYTFRLTKICDRAGNCWNGTKDYNHNVYANTTLMTGGFSSKNITTNELISSSNIADGTTKNLSITLKDTYGNEIIPAPGISRTIDFNWSVNNTMYLDQYDRSGNSVFLTSSNGSDYTNKINIGSNTTNLDGQNSTNGTYTYGFKFYTPTSNQDNGPVSDTSANFIINNLTFDINSSLTNPTGANPQSQYLNSFSQIKAKFNPLYYSELTGTGITQNGFIEGARQDSKISIKKNGSKTTSNNKLQLSYGGTNSGSFQMYAGTNKINATSTGTLITTRNNIVSDLLFTSNNNNLYTYLKQVPGSPVSSNSKIYLATHITYNITAPNGPGTITPVYNSDIVGKDSYHGTEDDLGIQSALKVLGQVSSKSNQSLVDDQYPSDVRIVGNSDKFLSKTQLRKNGWQFAKNVSGSTDTNNPLTNINNPDRGTHVNNVIYFGATSGAGDKVYQLGNAMDIEITKNKTILVIGGNLYIKRNLYYSGNGMLGIVVLKDENGKGGNIYVDPSVTNIVGTMFAEKSILGYNGTDELDGSVDVATLKNQLHIYGSLFTENTIGGSREVTPRCPYFITSGCTLELAQKYDLNYLRRYYLITDPDDNSYKKPANSAKVIGGGTYSSAGNLTGGNPSFARNITNTSDDYAGNSVLVEYNPRVQTNNPPLFDIR